MDNTCNARNLVAEYLSARTVRPSVLLPAEYLDWLPEMSDRFSRIVVLVPEGELGIVTHFVYSAIGDQDRVEIIILEDPFGREVFGVRLIVGGSSIGTEELDALRRIAEFSIQSGGWDYIGPAAALESIINNRQIFDIKYMAQQEDTVVASISGKNADGVEQEEDAETGEEWDELDD